MYTIKEVLGFYNDSKEDVYEAKVAKYESKNRDLFEGDDSALSVIENDAELMRLVLSSLKTEDLSKAEYLMGDLETFPRDILTEILISDK